MRFFTAILVIVILLALAATFGAIIVGTRSFEGLVVDKPYETGLAWDERQRQNVRLGWNVAVEEIKFHIGENELTVNAVDGSGRPLANAAVAITVSRPSSRDFDETYSTVQQKAGRYRARVMFPLYGTWDIAIDVSRNGDHGVYRHAVYAEQASAGSDFGAAGEIKTMCDIQAGPCSRTTADGMTVLFDIRPKPVAAMSEVVFSVAFAREGTPVMNVSSVMLDLSMPGMYMGTNRPVLKKISDGRYEGKGIITRCESGEKTWKAKITTVRDGKTLTADVIFEVK